MWSVEDGYTFWSELGTDSFVSEQHHLNNSKTYHLTPYIMHQLYQKLIKLNIGIRLWLHLSTHSIKKCLPEGQCTFHHHIDVYSLRSSCVAYFRI